MKEMQPKCVNLKTKAMRRRRMAAVTATVLILAMLLTGTFAWNSISQRATNPFDILNTTNYGGRLHDHFDRENKDVFAENFATDILDSEGNVISYAQPIFVRILLLEFMELNGNIFHPGSDAADVYTWARHIPVNDDPAHNEHAANGRFRDYVNWTMGGSTYFMPTFNRNPLCFVSDTSGYGEDFYSTTAGWRGGQTAEHANAGRDGDRNDGSADFWRAGDTATENIVRDGGVVDGTATTVPARPTINPVTAEITGGSAGAAAFIRANRGVITSYQWEYLERPFGQFWIIDTADGWAYWAAPLLPGTATSLLLDQAYIDTEPAGEGFYAIHAVAQFANADDVHTYWLADTPAVAFGTPSSIGREILEQITGRADTVSYDEYSVGDVFTEANGFDYLGHIAP